MDKIDNTLNDWWNYLRGSDDITSLTNLNYFKLLLRNLEGNLSYLDNQPITNHKLGWFLSWEILKVTWDVSYIVDFHVFWKWSTFIHSHWYDCNSFVLWWEISYEHFKVEEIPIKVYQSKAWLLKGFDTKWHILDTSIKEKKSDLNLPTHDLLNLIDQYLGYWSYPWYQEVIYFARLFNENPQLITEIERELLDYSIWKISFSELSLYSWMFLFVFLGNDLGLIRWWKSYLLHTFSKLLAIWWAVSYLSSDNAHKVDVENNAFTLFIKRFDKRGKLPWGNFKIIEEDPPYKRDWVRLSKDLSDKIKFAFINLDI